VTIRGRVGALLEVGTGFHPELTGRENVFLNGAILGMAKREIAAKFDRIVDFAEVGDFIDTPVKFYSSGMHVRLAFAVAAHLEPDVLLIDEVLAVGDAAFQRKCIASIRDATSSGRTALVVSHNMAFVQSLCSRAVLFERGRLVADGTPDEIVGLYHRKLGGAAYAASEERRRRPVHVAAVEMRDHRGHATQELPCGEGMTVRIRVHLDSGLVLSRPWVAVRLYSWHGQLLCHLANREAGHELAPLDGPATVVCEVTHLNLMPGEYQLGVIVADVAEGIRDRIENAVPLTVTRADVHGSGMLPSPEHGAVFFPSRWRVEAAPAEAPGVAVTAEEPG
jgi:lipopolysaccharide transport system ATP-binding protein